MAILSHHQSKVQTRLGFLVLALQQVEDYPTTKPYDSRTLAIGVLYVVNVLGSLYALFFYPRLDDLSPLLNRRGWGRSPTDGISPRIETR